MSAIPTVRGGCAVAGRVTARAGGVALLSALVAVLVLGVPLAQARSADDLTISVAITTTGQISASLSDGAPLGVTSGTPPVIPAGFYTLLLTSPGGCGSYPYFTMTGPGVNVNNNLDNGEETNMSLDASFQTNSTYTWSSSANPGVVYTFDTGPTMEGTPPVLVTSGSPTTISSAHSTASSSDLIGSASSSTTSNGSTHAASGSVLGVLTGSLGSSGGVVLRDHGTAVRRLKPGRYTITVKVTTTKRGMALRLGSHMLTIAAKGFVGTASRTVDLTAGTWAIVLGTGAKTAGTIAVA